MSLSIPDNVACIIPARAGSQGVLNKNLQFVGGLPLIVHSIRQALAAGFLKEKIFVSSDSEKILNIARESYQVVAVERPSELAGSKSSTESAMLHLLEQSSFEGDHILLLQPTSPIRLRGTINQFVQFYFHQNCDSALTTTKFYNFFWHIRDGNFVSTYDPVNRPMRQDLLPEDYRYFDNGNMYLTACQLLKDTQCRLGGKIGVFPVSEAEALQIDTPEDLDIVRAVMDGSILERCR